mmetsp:Transcript_83677/g.240509  ORF Transcript_83677/g.240509 Transcript_83677/m.240509 type:complete len:266 (-) Transcript_83677:560-1357(-)
MYLKPFFSSLSRVPLPSIAGYRSPCPGGHHSWPGSFSQVAGLRSLAVTLGALFCTNSRSAPLPSSSYEESASSVSADVANEFISMNLTLVLNCLFMEPTCFAIRSRKLLPSVTVSRDFALSRPMPVPRPPFSFRITVLLRRLEFGFTLSFSKSWRVSTGSSKVSGSMTFAPEASTPKLYLKAAMAAADSSSFSIFAWYAGQTSINFEGPTVPMMSMKVGFRDAPPTRKPSMLGLLMRSLQFSGVTLPPYWMRTLLATSALTADER